MPRKFNIGRQNEQSFNKEMHDLFMVMKYINSGYDTPVQDEQTEIPYGAMWNDPSFGKNVLKAYSQNRGWEPVFKGYYHPANLLQKPSMPVHGQVMIDSANNDILKYYDENTGSWIAAKALDANEHNQGIGGFDNFVNIFPLVPSIVNSGVNTYLIPNELSGRMFDGDKYIHPNDPSYKKDSEVTISFTDKDLVEEESWIHINPNRLNISSKKLFKVNKDINSHKPYQIDIKPYNTEFYGVDPTTKKGYLLRYKSDDISQSDYIYTDVGIQLTSRAYKYDYVYAISYSFASSAYPGSLTRNSLTIGTQDEVFVGAYNKHPFIFLDGLYLEQSFYDYDHQEGTVRITNDDITQKMDLVSVIFKDYSRNGEAYQEYTINQTNIQGVDAVVGPLTANTQAFKKPMAFVSGIMGGTVNIMTPDEVVINGTEATIKNIGPIGQNDEFKVMIVETDGMYLDTGTIDDTLAIQSPQITGDHQYILFVDGLMMSPREFNLSEGQIKITGAVQGQQWVLLKVDSSDETALIFDSPVSSFSARIIDKNENVTYNNCDAAVVYVGDGILIDQKTIEVTQEPTKGINGQIIKYKKVLEDGTAVESYKIWDYNTFSWLPIEDESAIKEISSLITYYSTKGSISIIDNTFAGQNMTYYAYTYNNSIDEPLLHDTRVLTKDMNRVLNVNFDHVFRPGQGSLTTFINNVLILSEEDSTGNGRFTIPELAGINMIDSSGKDWSTDPVFAHLSHPYDNGELLYIVERAEENEHVACRREILTAADRDFNLVNGYTTKMSLVPGMVSIYVNGIKIERQDFSIYGENTIVLHNDTVGGQEHCNPDDPTSLTKFAVKDDEGKIQYMNCLQSDEILVEVREDYRVKSLTLPVRYPGQFIFSVSDDGLSESILDTKDYVKIYINGSIYTGEYTISRDAGLITIEDPLVYNTLGIDAIDRYFSMNQIAYQEYQEEYGKYYPKKTQDRITFEWR